MGVFSKLFGGKNKSDRVLKHEDSGVVFVPNENERMNWAIEKAKLTLHYFEECLHSPKDHQSYFSIKVNIIDGEFSEHIWLTDPSFDEEGNLFGTVSNDPFDVTTVKRDQKIGIERKLVSDWMIIENGKLIGGYTIRAIRDGLKKKDLPDFDKSIGGLFVDEGEDYFIPNFDTPEGAILTLENAYDNDNIDEAINCKDFDKEAEIMLKEKGLPLDESILKSTSEVLKLSFTKYMQENGMPKYKGIKKAFPYREKITDDHYVITIVNLYPDGGKSIQKMNTYNNGDGWKVLSLVND